MKILNGKNELLKKILELMKSKQIASTKVTDKYMELIGITNTEVIRMTKEKLKERTKRWDAKLWIEEVRSISSLNLYIEWKKEIREEQIYNNRPSSVIIIIIIIIIFLLLLSLLLLSLFIILLFIHKIKPFSKSKYLHLQS